MSISGNFAVEAMTAVQARVEQTATRLAQAGSPGGDTVDLSAEMVALVEAKSSYAALAQVATAGNELRQKTLDILA